MNTFSLWILELLFFSLMGAHGLKYFPENFKIVRLNETVTLTCDTKTSGSITWKFDDNDLEAAFDENLEPIGQNLKVSNVEPPMLGNYSCWRGEDIVSSIYLLMEAEENQNLESDDSFKCRAKSYDCNFYCTWLHSGDSLVRIGLGHECTKGGDSCQWVSSSHQLDDGKFQFELSHSLSPFAEESTMLEVTAEAIADQAIIRRTKRFYLRDIIEPDSPQIGRCAVQGENLSVSINPPPTWSTPHSFFNLEHEIEYVLKDDGKTGYSSSAWIPKKISKLRVRSRDSVVLSSWSQWTPWKNVITGRSLCKCKNKAKYCCPELPSGFLDQCKKKRKKGRNKSKARQLKKIFNKK